MPVLFVEGEQKKTGRVLYYRTEPTGRIIFPMLDEIDSCDYSCPTSAPLAASTQMHDLSPPSGQTRTQVVSTEPLKVF